MMFAILGIAIITSPVTLKPILGTDPEGATRVLEASGYKDINITGYKWFNGSDEFYNTAFVATAPNGAKITGCVTKGFWFKGSTIRLD